MLVAINHDPIIFTVLVETNNVDCPLGISFGFDYIFV